MKSKKLYKNKITKKYIKDFLDRLDYLSAEMFDGGTIVYPNNLILAYLMDIEYNDEFIEQAIKTLEKERSILRVIKQREGVHPPFEYYIDVIPF